MSRRQFGILILLLCAAALCPETRAQNSIDPIVARLLKDLDNAKPGVRARAAVDLGNMAAHLGGTAARGTREQRRVEPAVPALAHAMKDKDKDVREMAVFALGNILADPEISIPALIEGLRDQTSSVRNRSAEILGYFGGDAQAAVPALVGALRDQDNDVQEQAAKTIGKIGGDPQILVPALINAFKNSTTTGWSAAEALAKFGKDASSAVPTLIEILRKPADPRRAYALLVLGAIGPGADAAVPALVDALKDPDRYVAATAAAALGRIGQKQENAAAVAARLVAEDLGEEPWWTRAAAAKALGELGLHAETALPALSKVLGPINAAGSSERAADAILRIAAGLRDVRRTSAIPVLKSCQTAMERSQSGYVRTKALDLSEIIASLEAIRQSSPTDLAVGAVQAHPWIALAIGVYASLGLLWTGLFWLWPMSIFRTGQLVRAFPKVKLPGWLGGIEISFAHLTLLGFFENRDHVLDAWVAKNADAARGRFEEIETVRRSGSLPLARVILDGVTTQILQPSDLRPAFTRSKTCVLIHGEPETGKTRLACEIARWGMAVDRNERLRKHLVIPALLDEMFSHTAENDVSPLIQCVSERLQVLDLDPPPEEVIVQLLRRKRLLVIIDGFSELNEETRANIRPASPDFPAHALLVTSCKEETMGGIRRTMVRTISAPGG
jgi:HEAT repeat protein